MPESNEFVAMVNQVNYFAEQEGWAIFNLNEIQKDDDSTLFQSDDEAREHVRKLADAGSALHKLAIRIVDNAASE